MSGVNFIFRTDVHASDHTPVSWKGNYLDEIWASLIQIGELARKYGSAAVLDGGDYFHNKSSHRNSHSLVYQTIVIHKQYPCPVYMVVGNHDILYNDLETLPKQPLGVLFSCSTFYKLEEAVFTADGIKVRVVGLHYSRGRVLEDFKIDKKDEDYLVVVSHASASEASSSLKSNDPVFGYSDLMALSDNGPDVWCFGHQHLDQGIVEIDGKWFVGQGAVSRGSLDSENISRVPKVASIQFTSDGVSITQIPLDVAGSSEVFDFERKVRLDTEKLSIERFVATLQSDASFDPNKEVESNIKNLDFAEDVKVLALEYLERVRS